MRVRAKGGAPAPRTAVVADRRRPSDHSMTVLPHDLTKTPPPAPRPPEEELSLFSRIEGLVGQETALLRVPAAERSADQRAHLRAISDELDRIWHRLQARAQAAAAVETARP
ncbi:MAG: hypothetical protein JWN65_848 [Solirubrobacterales bacterium]|nr:hypothetical protein [Solirubrobacterales bacterium]